MPKTTAVLRDILYPDIKTRVLRGDHALTAKQAKELLGWQTEEDYIAQETASMSEKQKEKFAGYGGDYLLLDELKNKIRCVNNDHNRPFSESWCRTIAQDILHKNWRLNGESIIIGKTGRVLSAQHRLVGLVLADQMWHGDDKLHWEQFWQTPPTIESIIVYGIEESPEYTRTLDNVKPRSLADVLFSDHLLYGKVKKNDRGPLCRMTQHAVRMLWDRMPNGAGRRRRNDAFSPHLTHSEAIDFIEKHKHVVQAVQIIYGLYTADNKWKANNERMSAGYAAGLLYLMGASDSDIDDYMAPEVQSEKKLKWTAWDKACDYWKAIVTGDAAVHEVRYALSALYEADSGSAGGSRNEKAGILVKGWLVYKEGHKVTHDDVQLKRGVDRDGLRFLDDFPTCGGVDLGPNVRQSEEEEAAGPGSDPTPEEIEAQKEELRRQREESQKRKEEERKAKRNGRLKAHAPPEEEEATPEEPTEEPAQEEQPAEEQEPVATE